MEIQIGRQNTPACRQKTGGNRTDHGNRRCRKKRDSRRRTADCADCLMSSDQVELLPFTASESLNKDQAADDQINTHTEGNSDDAHIQQDTE